MALPPVADPLRLAWASRPVDASSVAEQTVERIRRGAKSNAWPGWASSPSGQAALLGLLVGAPSLIKFNVRDAVFELVLQFELDGLTGRFVVVL